MVLEATALQWLTITEAAKAFRSHELSPVELTRHLLERSERLQEILFAFVTFTPEMALADARAAEAALLRGEADSPLLGIPMGFKDIYFTKDVRTTGGSQLLKGFVPDFDATTVRLLRQAGVVMLGKTTTTEFASGGSDILQSYFPSARNPWNPAHSPAGSSSGSGAALAAGLVAGALGTDTGGSIRGPAAANGISGIKPTFGRCSRYGVFPLSWGLDHTGPMARTVEDLALMLNVIAGYDPLDTHSAIEPVQDYTLPLNHPIKGLRVGVPTPDYFAGSDAEVIAALNEAVEVLVDLGAVVVEVTIPPRTQGNFNAEAHTYHRPDLLETPENFGPNLAQRHLSGGAYFAFEFIQQQRLRAMVKEQMHQILLACDVVLTPGSATPAPTMEEAAQRGLRPGAGGAGGMLSFAGLFNQTGLPSLAIPNGFSESGLPLSLQISGRPFDEATVLQVGHAFQSVTGWHLRHPAL